MSGPPSVSVVIRARDEASSIGRTLELLGAQELAGAPPEVIVVDSESSDATAQIARRAGARVITMPAREFTFGGALNRGCAAAGGELIVALSAHAFPPDPGWLSRLLCAFEDERVACASGDDRGPDGRLLDGPVLQDAQLARRHPLWGYSSAAGAFRAELWRRRPFRTDMPGTEDKEWAWYWLARGRLVVIGPGLATDHHHGDEPPLATFRRARREWEGYRMFLDLGPYGARELVAEWWRDPETYRSQRRARLSHRRAARLAGKYVAARRRPAVIGSGAAGEGERWEGEEGGSPPPSEAGSRPRKLRLAVMVDSFPALSESFVSGEVAELRRQGHRVRVEAIGETATPNWDAARGVPVGFMSQEGMASKLRDLAWLVLRHPWGAAGDLFARRAWAREEHVRPLRALAGRARRISAEGVEHVHVHFAQDSALDAFRLHRILGLPYSVTAHAFDIFLEPRNLTLKLEHAAFVTTGCEYNARHLRALLLAQHADKIHVQIQGVDAEAFRRQRPIRRAREVLAVGRLVPKKGFDVLVEAAALLREHQAVDRVRIVGDGPERAALEARIALLGLEGTVELVGSQPPDQVRAELERASVLAVPSVIAPDGDRDSMPVVAKEALAMEVPVVASEEVGLPELIRPEWGRLVAPGDPVALAAALAEVLGLTSAARAEMGATGRRWVVRSCNLGREVAGLAEHIAMHTRRPSETLAGGR